MRTAQLLKRGPFIFYISIWRHTCNYKVVSKSVSKLYCVLLFFTGC